MQPESSDGFASVRTILPEERAALLPGGSFRFLGTRHTVFSRSTFGAGAGSVHCFPHSSQSHAFTGSALSRIGSSAPQWGHLGATNSGISVLYSSIISFG